VTSKLIPAMAAVLFVVAVGLVLGSANASAATKRIDCNQVMSKLQGGKKVKDVAKDMNISTSSVYRCRKLSKTSTGKAVSSATTSSSPTSAPSPASRQSAKKSNY
jgi:transposase-like protein